MIDLHCHILPGVDDGARSLAEAVAMCKAAEADGCTAMVATPHQRRGEWLNADRGRLASLRQELAAALAASGSRLRVLLGGEIHADDQLLAEVEKLPGGSLLTLAGTHYLLVELDTRGEPEDAVRLVHELVVARWFPVIAHPEFISYLAADIETVTHLVQLGAAVQVTAMSLTGDLGRRPQQSVERMLDAGLVHFVASDAHDLRRRPPGLSRAHHTLTSRWGEETARRLLQDHAEAVLADRPLSGQPRQAAPPARAPETPEMAGAGREG